MRRRLRWLLLVGALSLHCNHGDAAGESFLDVVDESSSWVVNSVYLVRTSQHTAWGADWLSADLQPGESRSLAVAPDTYDIRIESTHPQGTFERTAIPFLADAGVTVRVRQTDITIAY